MIDLPLVGCRGGRGEAQFRSEIFNKLVESISGRLERVNPRERTSKYIRPNARCENREEVPGCAPACS